MRCQVTVYPSSDHSGTESQVTEMQCNQKSFSVAALGSTGDSKSHCRRKAAELMASPCVRPDTGADCGPESPHRYLQPANRPRGAE